MICLKIKLIQLKDQTKRMEDKLFIFRIGVKAHAHLLFLLSNHIVPPLQP